MLITLLALPNSVVVFCVSYYKNKANHNQIYP